MLPIFKISIKWLHILNKSTILQSDSKTNDKMDKVVILARVSTDKQEYQRQVNELTDYCTRIGWNV